MTYRGGDGRQYVVVAAGGDGETWGAGDAIIAFALPRSIAWQPAAPLLHARSAHAVVSTGDAIYAIGGTGEGGAPVLDVERYDGNAWREETKLPGDGLNAPAAVAIGKRIYVIGGFKTTTNVPTSDVLIYDTGPHTWSDAAPLPAPRGGHAAVVLDGKIHVIGGGNSRSTLADHSEYDPAINKWTDRAPLSRSKGSPAAVAFDGKLYSIVNPQTCIAPCAGRQVECGTVDRAARHCRGGGTLRDHLRIRWRIASQENDARRGFAAQSETRWVGEGRAHALGAKLRAGGRLQGSGLSRWWESDSRNEPFVGGEQTGREVRGLLAGLSRVTVAGHVERSS